MDAAQLQGWAVVILAIGQVINIVLTHLAGKKAGVAAVAASVAAAGTTAAVAAQSDNIDKIEKATNSMKDVLVKATGEAAYRAGVADAKAEEKK